MTRKYPPLPSDIVRLPVSRMRMYQLQKKRLGLCAMCAAAAMPKRGGGFKVRCEKHNAKHNAYNALYRGRQKLKEAV